MRTRPLVFVLIAQIAVIGVFIALVVTDNLPFVSDDEDGCDAASSQADSVPRAKVDRFDGRRAFALLRHQVELGPRPAGSPTSRRLARELRAALPGGRFQRVPGGLRNVIGSVPGREPGRRILVGAHYDTKDLPDFVGANDGASGTAVAVELARSIGPRILRPTIVFALFDGEESPRGAPEGRFLEFGLRGSKVAAPRFADAEAMILLDFVGEKGLRLPRELNSTAELWERLLRAAGRVGTGRVFPRRVRGAISDDHVPFLRRGVPAVDLIDFEFACFHRSGDDLSVVSERSVDAVGESVLELLRTM